MKSMTGYGKGEASSASRKVTVELKSVNNRYLDITMRLPRTLAFAEEPVKKQIQARLNRGTVDVFFTYELCAGSGKTVSLDESLLKGYISAAEKIKADYGIENNISFSDIVKIPDIINISPAPEDTDEISALFAEAAAAAADSLDAMRSVEGMSAKANLLDITGGISCALEEVKQRAPGVVADYREKLSKRIGELLGELPVDEARIAAEVAVFADKCDINEEISRLSSHISQFVAALDLDVPVGRKLEFLSQEMNREINTMGSKANDLNLTQHVIFMKNELEKIKEQIRNIE